MRVVITPTRHEVPDEGPGPRGFGPFAIPGLAVSGGHDPRPRERPQKATGAPPLAGRRACSGEIDYFDFSAAWAAARRATGTRNGEQDT